MFLWRKEQEEVNMGLIDGWLNRKSKAKGHRSQHQGWEVLSCSGTTWGQGDRPRLPPPRSPGQSECQKMPSIIILIIQKDENMNTHLSSKDLSALQISQVDRLLHLVLVAVSLVGGTPFIILNAILLTLIKKSGQPYWCRSSHLINPIMSNICQGMTSSTITRNR